MVSVMVVVVAVDQKDRGYLLFWADVDIIICKQIIISYFATNRGLVYQTVVDISTNLYINKP